MNDLNVDAKPRDVKYDLHKWNVENVDISIECFPHTGAIMSESKSIDSFNRSVQFYITKKQQLQQQQFMIMTYIYCQT